MEYPKESRVKVLPDSVAQRQRFVRREFNDEPIGEGPNGVILVWLSLGRPRARAGVADRDLRLRGAPPSEAPCGCPLPSLV